jgi:hypothetical protein
MTPGATFSFEVLGKDHEHITVNARQELKKYIGTEDNSVIDHVNYEIIVAKHEDIYKATVTARVKL